MKTAFKEWFATTAIILSVFSVIFTATGFPDARSSEITSNKKQATVKVMKIKGSPHYIQPLIFTPARFEADANRANPRCVQRPLLYNALNTR